MMLLGCLFSFLQKVSGQQTLYECIKYDFFKICCSHPCFKENQVEKIKLSWIPKCLRSIYFIKFLSFLCKYNPGYLPALLGLWSQARPWGFILQLLMLLRFPASPPFMDLSLFKLQGYCTNTTMSPA